MLLLVACVQFGIVRLFGDDHSKDDLEEPLAQTPQGTTVGHALRALLLIVGLAPGTGSAEAVGPQMHGVTQELVAGPAEVNFVQFTRLVRDRSSARDTLKHLVATVAVRVAPQRRQQPGRQDLLGSGQAAKQIMVGMLSEKSLDLFAVEGQLLGQGAEQFTQADGQLAFGSNNGLGGLELVGLSEKRQAFLGRFRPPQPVGVQELLPAALAGTGQGLRRREGQDELPGGGVSPILEGLESRRIVFEQGLLQLIDQRRTLLDQGHFISAQQA